MSIVDYQGQEEGADATQLGIGRVVIRRISSIRSPAGRMWEAAGPDEPYDAGIVKMT